MEFMNYDDIPLDFESCYHHSPVELQQPSPPLGSQYIQEPMSVNIYHHQHVVNCYEQINNHNNRQYAPPAHVYNQPSQEGRYYDDYQHDHHQLMQQVNHNSTTISNFMSINNNNMQMPPVGRPIYMQNAVVNQQRMRQNRSPKLPSPPPQMMVQPPPPLLAPMTNNDSNDAGTMLTTVENLEGLETSDLFQELQPPPTSNSSPTATTPSRKISPAPHHGREALPFIVGETQLWKSDEMVKKFNEFNLFKVSDWRLLPNAEEQWPYGYFQQIGDAMTIGHIRFIKTLDGFKELEDVDKENLVKGATVELFVLRSLMYSDVEGQYIAKKDELGQLRRFSNAKMFSQWGEKAASQFSQLVKAFRFEWRSDMRLMLIIYAICIFTPERGVQKEFISYTQQVYYKMLLHYLLFLYRDTNEAENTFVELRELTAFSRQLAEEIRIVIKSGATDEFLRSSFNTQLLSELLNMNSS